MQQNVICLYLSLAMLLSSGACKVKPASTAPDTCKTQGIVEDYSGLDGCRWLIRLPDGTLLLPGELPEGQTFEFRDKQHIRFDYRAMEGAVSICMAESAIVAITCISEEKSTAAIPNLPPCLDIDDPIHVDWLLKEMENRRPVEIQKFVYKVNGWAYHLAGSNPVVIDCQGTIVAEGAACKNAVVPLGEGKVIWRAAGASD